jgi:hypothetical protein
MPMEKYLRPLALINVVVAVVLLMPVVFWTVLENVSRGDLRVTLPKSDTSAQALAEIQSTTDIEKLRHRAKVLSEMREFDGRAHEADRQTGKQILEWLWMLMALSGTAFLLNAAAIWRATISRKQP